MILVVMKEIVIGNRNIDWKNFLLLIFFFSRRVYNRLKIMVLVMNIMVSISKFYMVC